MRIFLNAALTDRPYGGANSFLRTLVAALRTRGAAVVHDIDAVYDVALVNGLTEGFGLAEVRKIHARGIPIVHRKVGYRERGSAELRREVDGVIAGDRLQIEFEPYVDVSVFQSRYSYDLFRASGYSGPHSQIIPNGVDPHVFSHVEPARFFWRQPRQRTYWDGHQIFRFAISTWSADASKGFRYYQQFDSELAGMPDVAVDFVGRMPKGTFNRIQTHSPLRARALASFLRNHHGYLAFSEHDTCSNALLEAISCGLQVIFLNSGSHREFAAPYGVEYAGDFRDAVRQLLQGYRERQARMSERPFDIGPIADRYLSVFLETVKGLYRDHAESAAKG